MAALTAQQMTRMQATQEAHMMDVGHVLTFDEGEKGKDNVRKARWILQPSTICGFQFANKTGETLGRADVPVVDAKLRLPLGTEVCSWDRFRLTHRLGNVLDVAVDYEIKGEPRVGPSGIYCDLMQAQDVTLV